MKWFGRKSAGREESRPVLSRVGAGVPVIGEWPRSYEAQVRDAYLGNAVAQRAVRLVAEGVGAAPVAASSPELAALIDSRELFLERLAQLLPLRRRPYQRRATRVAKRRLEHALRGARVRVGERGLDRREHGLLEARDARLKAA